MTLKIDVSYFKEIMAIDGAEEDILNCLKILEESNCPKVRGAGMKLGLLFTNPKKANRPVLASPERFRRWAVTVVCNGSLTESSKIIGIDRNSHRQQLQHFKNNASLPNGLYQPNFDLSWDEFKIQFLTRHRIFVYLVARELLMDTEYEKKLIEAGHLKQKV